jgi:tryptophan-rich sensory protein
MEPWKDKVFWIILLVVILAYIAQSLITNYSGKITDRWDFRGVPTQPWLYITVWSILHGFLVWIGYQAYQISQKYFLLFLTLLALNIVWVLSLYYYNAVEFGFFVLLAELAILLFFLIDGWLKFDKVSWAFIFIYMIWIVAATYFNIRLWWNRDQV